METRIDEIAEGIHRVSTYVPDADFTFNQYLVAADEPLLFHTGFRHLFPTVAEAVGRVLPVERLRWITFGHVEGDECGAMNQWLAAAPDAAVAHTAIGCIVQVNDLADRPPRPLGDGEVLDLGSHRVRNLDTPHVPHAWDAHLLYEEVTGTLLCGDLFTATGKHPVATDGDVVEPALAAEQMFKSTCLTPSTAPVIRALADLAPSRLALMHGPVYEGDAAKALGALADGYDELFRSATAAA